MNERNRRRADRAWRGVLAALRLLGRALAVSGAYWTCAYPLDPADWRGPGETRATGRAGTAEAAGTAGTGEPPPRHPERLASPARPTAAEAALWAQLEEIFTRRGGS
ncbi:DUF6059 family protein [Nonomuraea sp. NPDC050783]|uniref:DUF6059 family protein n=1 Tax=Nonomuraea sp. NPDC050783 TaxID=3154634 RepID=UPI0034656555